MDKIVITNRQVKQVRQDGIIYIDDAGDEQFIDFELCYQNYLERLLSPESIENIKKSNRMTDDDVAEFVKSMKSWRAVADRNVDGDDFMNGANNPPYLEFYTKPRVRIEFERRELLNTMRYWIEKKYRWRTSDLT